MKFGQYELLERIAIGGMAEVYKGRVVGAEGFEKLVAIKRIQPDLAADERFVSMLLTEARIHSALSHRNIVQIHDLGISEEGEYFIVLEYVEGYDLRAIMESITAEGEIIPEALSLHIAAEVAQALHFAHELRGPDGQPLGLIHRDVSPSNVLISFAGEVKLSDFGLAKRRHDRSVVGSLKGNLIYMSPEQARQAPLDRRTDVFSLGALLFELLTGKRLREITDEIKGWGEVAAGVVRSARSARPDLPASFEALLNQALAADPNRRFADAGTFGAAIRQLLSQMNTPVGPADLQALLGLVTPPKKPRGDLERSKVIRLVPEAGQPRRGTPPQDAAAGRGLGVSPLDRLRAAARPPAPAISSLGPRGVAAKPAPPPPTDDVNSLPATPPPVTAARPRPLGLRPPPRAGAAHNTLSGGFSMPGATSGRPRITTPGGSTVVGPGAVPAPAPVPASAFVATPPARPKQETHAAVTPPPPFGTTLRSPGARLPPRATVAPALAAPGLTPPSMSPLVSRSTTTPGPTPPPSVAPGPSSPRVSGMTPAFRPRGKTPASLVPGPPPPPDDASLQPTPPPISATSPGGSSSPAVPSFRDGAPSAPTWQPAESSRPFQALDQDTPGTPLPSTPAQGLPIGRWRSAVVGFAALLVVAAFVVHVGVIPLEVLVSWKKPAPLYIASEPEGGWAKLDGVRLVDPTPTKIAVTRDRNEHVIEVEYPGFQPAREIVRFDRSVALSFMIPLQKDSDGTIAPVSAPSRAEP